MKTMTDNNFLGGKLIITTQNNTTIGRLQTYNTLSDELIDFIATTTCKPDEDFNTNTGIKIIRLKLTKKYYSYVKQYHTTIINKHSKIVSNSQNKIEFLNKKLNHIQSELQKF